MRNMPEMEPIQRRIAQDPETGTLMIPRWLDALTGGASTKPAVIEAVITYQGAACALKEAEDLYDRLNENPGSGSDLLVSARILGDAKANMRRAEGHLPLWAKIWEALP